MTRSLATHVAEAAVSGHGKQTMVFLHGVFMDHTMWGRVIGQVDGARTIAIDMPGHGDSPAAPAGATLDDHIASVAASLDELGVKGALVVGHSWGGMVAIRLAALRPDLVAGLVLTNTPLVATTGSTRFGFRAQRAMLLAGFPPGIYGRMAASSLMGAGYRAQHSEDIGAMERRLSRTGRSVIRETLRSVLLEPGDGIGWLEQIAVPWIAVAGADDYVIAGGVSERVQAVGELWIATGAHSTPLEAPDIVAEAIAEVQARMTADSG